MPKSIIREFDKSTTGTTLAVNFSVLVPGFMSPALDGDADLIEAAKKDGIYFEDSQIYRLNSQKQFLKYIGKFVAGPETATGPTLERLQPIVDDVITAFTSPVRYEVAQATTDAAYYSVTFLEQTDPKFGTNGRLVKTFISGNQTSTYVFTRVSLEDLERDQITVREPVLDENNEPTSEYTEHVVSSLTKSNYAKIKFGNEGNDSFAGGEHMGNQIAYELLGLGYTVYFKKLNSGESALSQLRNPDFWEPLKNKSTYRIRYITSGGCYNADVASKMSAIAMFASNEATPSVEQADTYGYETGRGDCIALLDVDEEDTKIQLAKTRAEILTAYGEVAGTLPANKYCAIFAPRVIYNLPEDAVYSSDAAFPGSFHYLACAAQAQQRYAEWYAVAGYTRGICPLSIAHLTQNFGDIDINTLAPRVANTYIKAGQGAINLILNERGSYYLWGNRTSYPIDADGLIFSHFLNIRQLCCTIKQVLYEATRKYTFDPNSDLLWVSFVNSIKPTLESMKADQGIKGYRITRVATDKKALLVARIRIVPIEALEDFDISIYLEDSLSGVILSADETLAE